MNGAQIETWVYVVDDKKEQSLLGKENAMRLGIVTIQLNGAKEEVVHQISSVQKQPTPPGEIVSGEETQEQIDQNMQELVHQFPDVFTDKTGKFDGKHIKIQISEDVTPIIQPSRKIPMHYLERTKAEISKMLEENIIEGPLEVEEPGTFIRNLVITDKKGSDRIRVTLDCQAVNKSIYATHEPIPSTEELRHSLKGGDQFSTLDMTNCYYQFEIEESARKLYAFRTSWGIYRYKRMVMGTSPASSEIQKRIRETISSCTNAIHIKDDILVHGTGKQHDHYLKKVIQTLKSKGITF